MASPGSDGGFEDPISDLDALIRTAERLDELADTAEMMGDPDGATRFRESAATARLRAMRHLDE